MNSYQRITMAILLAFSSLALAGQENRGASLPPPHYDLLASCNILNDDIVEIRKFDNGSLEAIVTLDWNKASVQQKTYSIRQVITSHGPVGAPIQFTGKGFGMSIQVDGLRSRKGYPALVTAPAMRLSNTKAVCKMGKN